MSCLVKKLSFSKLFNMYIVCMFLPFVVNKDEYIIYFNHLKGSARISFHEVLTLSMRPTKSFSFWGLGLHDPLPQLALNPTARHTGGDTYTARALIATQTIMSDGNQ